MNLNNPLRTPYSAFRARAARRAFTLIELLVVVVIVLSLTAIAIPLLVPSRTERQMLESSRIVTGALARARSMAIETRRPAGVVLEKQLGQEFACFQLSFAEVPPPYAGGVTDARIHIGELGDTNGNSTVDAPDEDWNGDTGFFTAGLVRAITDTSGNPDLTWLGLVKPGDQLRLNHQGELYTIYTSNISLTSPVNVDATTGTIAALATPTEYWVLLDSSGNLANVRTPPPVDYNEDGDFQDAGEVGGLPFQIIRQPTATSSVGTPVQVPATVAINLAESSVDGYVLSDYPGNVTILLSPGGTIHSVRWAGISGMSGTAPAPIVPSSPVYLMLGKREFIPVNLAPAAGEPTYSFQDLQSRWVGVSHTSGIPVSAPPAALDPTLPCGTLAEKWARIIETRRLLSENQLGDK